MNPHRWRLSRAGLLNVWQYDDQVFDFADGRLLLRGTNGAGKSKTLEMLLPFVLDGDRARMDASGKRGSLTFLMLDGYEGASRIGYLWLELSRVTEAGETEHVTAGVGLKAAGSTKTVTLWCFLLPGRPIPLEDSNGTPLSPPACREAVVAAGGEYFDSPRAYKAAVGRTLFGLDEAGYDDLLRLLYWLRTPQVGESVEVSQLDRTLSDSLPELDRSVVEAAAASLDELQELGEQLERRQRASEEVQRALASYRRYAAGEVRRRVTAAITASEEAEKARRAHRRAESALAQAEQAAQLAEQTRVRAVTEREAAHARKTELETSQAARDLEALEEMRKRVDLLRQVAGQAAAALAAATARLEAAEGRVQQSEQALAERQREVVRLAEGAQLRVADLPRLTGDPTAWADQLPGLTGALAAHQAAWQLCIAALGTWEAARAQQERAEEREAEQESGLAAAQGVLAQAEGTLEQATDALAAAVAGWLHGAPLEARPEQLEDAAIWARDVTAEPLRELHGAAGHLAARIDDLQTQQDELVERRVTIEAEHDPAPPGPALARDERAGRLALWEVVDPKPDLSIEELAGLEAALQSSGLLDALVLTDGRLQGRDLAVLPGNAAEGRSLADVLAPAGDLPAETVLAALRSVALEGTGPAVVRADGSWVLGALEGRAAKPEAQFLGAAARAAERQRRLAAIDTELESTRRAQEHLEAERRTAVVAAEQLTQWRDAAPSSEAVRAARAAVGAARTALDVQLTNYDAAVQHAHAARAVTARQLGDLRRLGDEHGLPVEREALEQRRVELQDARHHLELLARELASLGRQSALLQQLVADEAGAQDELATSASRHDETVREAEAQSARYDARREALSATQVELQRALAEAAEDLLDATTQESAAHAAELVSREALTECRAELARRSELLDEAEHGAAAADLRAGALRAAPGLLEAVGVSDDLGWPELRDAVAELPVADSNTVFAAYQQLLTGSAGGLQPRQREAADGLIVLSVRDEVDGADLPLAAVAARLAVRVADDQALLTKQHREVCERHLLGELGEVLRRRRLEASQLVAHMNDLLDGVRTSQGIRVRLDWRLRDDLADEARGTVKLLERPIGALLPDQREQLLNLLSQLIESGRRENPDGSYAEHLRDALDYRRWSTFAVRVRRAGAEQEERLSKRTALSQGEQKVVCYLPLFAAAAAHFSSVAAATPHAPRFVLLDDAFPKIDVRTHPVLFGLLVDLDLDWLITSERLWADCETVPAAAIYEVIRSPTERGVLPFKHLWDGRRLTAVGA